MITLLLVSADDALRHRLEAALEDISLFVAATDLDAIKQLRMVDIDVAVRPVTARATAFSRFAEKARLASPRTVLVWSSATRPVCQPSPGPANGSNLPAPRRDHGAGAGCEHD